MTQDPYQELSVLLERDPPSYRAKLEELRVHAPDVLAGWIEHMRTDLENANEKEDRELTDLEVEAMVQNTAAALGWPRRRVLAEAVLRLRAAALYGPREAFRPLTPETTPETRKGRYVRRHSSIRALALGEIRAAVAAHVKKPG